MNTMTNAQERAAADFSLMPIFAAMALGLGVLYFTGFAQAAQYHDSAHDTRHTLAFPCH